MENSNYIKKFDDPAKNFEPYSEEEHEFLQTHVEQYLCHISWRSNLQEFPAQRFDVEPINSRAIAYGLHLGAQRTTKISKRMAMNRNFQGRKDLIQCVQRQVKTLIDRTDAYSMQKVHGWKTFHWSRNTMLSDPAAKLIRMEVHVYSDATMRVGVSNPDPSNNRATCNEHGLVETLILAAREVQFILHVLPCASTINIMRHIRTYLNGQNPKVFRRTDHVHVSVQRHWMAKGRQHRKVFAWCQRSGRIFDKVQARALVLPGARVRKYVVERKSSNFNDNGILPHCRWLTYSGVTFPPDISSDRTIIAWTAEKRRNTSPFPR